MFGIKNSTIIRSAIGAGVGLSTYGISTAIIRNNTADPETLAQKAALATGSFVIGSMVAEKAAAWADTLVETVMNSFDAGENGIRITVNPS